MLKNKQTIIFFLIIFISAIALFSISYFHSSLHGIIEYIIFLSFYIILGKDVFKNAALDFVKGKFMRESFLMTVATLGAIFIHELPEALAVLVFYRIGIYFEDKAVNRSRNTIASLVAVRADYANIIKQNGSIEKTDISNVKINDEIIVYPFEKVPLDCVITNGESWMDTKILTGESMPKTVKENSEILAGMVNGESQIKAKVIRVYAESSIAKILRLVEESSNRKAKIENFIGRFAAIYTPIVVFSAVLLTIIPTLIFGREVFSDWFTRSLTLLVVSCPCAFIVGIPLTYFASIGRASKMGVIVKGGVFLDALAKTKTVIFDKTGTLTKGEFSIKNIYNNNIIDNDTLIKYAAYSEYGSAHPIAKSVVEYYISKNGEIKTSLIENHKDISGKGVISKIEGKTILVGGKSLMTQNKIDLPKIDEKINVLIAIDGKYAGGIEVDDSIKEDTHSAILELKKMKIKTAVLSGDLKERVQSFAREIDIDMAEGGCLPENKVEKLESMMKGSKGSVFVGDGINDAPSLARADIGIAMGGLGSDAAVENADVVIMDDKPSKVAGIIKLAQKTNSVVWQNITLAFAVKLFALILGAMGKAPIWIAILADTGVTAIVVFNAIRILYPLGEKHEHIEESEHEVATHCSCCNH